MKRILSILLIIIGVLFLLTPFITEQLITYYSKSLINSDISNESLKANNEKQSLSTREIEYDFTAIEDVDIVSVIKGSQNLDKNLVIGILYIPDLNINLPIMKGLSDANLMAGAATMKANQTFGVGNYTLAGHIMKNKNLLFARLMDIEIDTPVYVSDGEYIYEYIIYDTKVVPDTAIDMISDDKADIRNKAIISLMTCYFSSKTGKRFFAIGELVDKYPVD